MTPKPAIGTRLRDLHSGHESVVTDHTARGFTYKGEPRSFIARWGMSFTGEGEIYTDHDPDFHGSDWRDHYEVIEPNFDI